MTRILFIVLSTIFLNTIQAQTFERDLDYISTENFQSSEAGCIFKTSNNELLMTSVSIKGSSFWVAPAFLNITKLDSTGNIITSKEFPFSTGSIITTITELSNGNFVLTSGIDSDGGILMFDNNLTIIWAKYFGDRGNNGYYYDRLIRTIETSDGNLVTIGTSGSMTNGQASLYVTKLTMNGTIIWGKTFGLGGDEDGTDIVEINNSYYAYGYGTGLYGATVPWVIKINNSGNMVWAKVIAGPLGGGNCRNLHVINNNQLLLTYEDAYTNYNQNLTKSDIYVSVVDSNLNNIWTKRYARGTYNKISTTLIDEQQNIYISGFLDYDTSYRSTSLIKENIPFLTKISSSGNMLWTKTYEQPNKYDIDFLASNFTANIALLNNNIYSTYTLDSVNSSTQQPTNNIHLNKMNANGNTNCNNSTVFSQESAIPFLKDITDSVYVLSGGYTDNIVTSPSIVTQFTEIGGCNEASSIKELSKIDLILYPNPVSKLGYLKINSSEKIKKALIYKSNGKLIASLSKNMIEEINLSNLHISKGVFILKLVSENDYVFTKRLIITD